LLISCPVEKIKARESVKLSRRSAGPNELVKSCGRSRFLEEITKRRGVGRKASGITDSVACESLGVGQRQQRDLATLGECR
jgi:hypothetical protein